MSTKIDKNGIICNKIVADELQTSDGTKYFKETDLDSITINDAAIENATKIAVNAATSAENDATDANTAKLAAETAAENALASSTAAEQAKTDALAAQTKAEEEAAKAEQNAALLGDAALKSADNEFTGSNTFSGEAFGLMPHDFMKYAWVQDAATLKEVCEDLYDRKSWYFYTPRLGGSFPLTGGLSNIETALNDVCFYSEHTDIHSFLPKGIGGSTSMHNLIYVVPNVTTVSYVVSNNNAYSKTEIDNVEIYAPKATSILELFRRGYPRRLKMVVAADALSDSTLGNRSSSALDELVLPLNVFKTVNLSQAKLLRRVASGFSFATVINFQSAALDKESVLTIVNSLQTYDSAAMTAVPELTLGIDPALDGDEEINAALLNAQTAVADGGKGWNVAVDGFTITTDEATAMGLRKPVYIRRWVDAEGGWVDADGMRWAVRYGNTVLENWVANEQLGYEEFASLDDALEHWGLTEYQPPIEEMEENI